jgi:hypothetical protein
VNRSAIVIATMNIMKKFVFGVVVFLGALPPISEAGVKNPVKSLKSSEEKQNYLPILHRWSGEYPIAHIDRLKERHYQSHGGYISNEAAFVSFWDAFRRGSAVPTVDFTKNLVVFVIGDRNSRQMFIAKVTLKDTIADVVADGNTSGSSREDSLEMALAVIPRTGVKVIRVGNEQLPVE